MEDAARQSVLEVFRFEDNFLSGIVVVMNHQSTIDERTLYVRFTLNGKEFQFEEKMDIRVIMIDKRRAFELLMEGVRNAILEQLIPHVGKELMK